MNAELDIRSTGLDANLANYAYGGVAHALVFTVSKRLRRRHGNGVARVNAHRIKVLDGADDDDVVPQVAHHLKLVFLPAQHRFFDQHFMYRGKVEAARENLHQFFAVVSEAAT